MEKKSFTLAFLLSIVCAAHTNEPIVQEIINESIVQEVISDEDNKILLVCEA
jgi:hypothetical protein